MSTTLTSIRSESPVFSGAPRLLNVFLWAAIAHSGEKKTGTIIICNCSWIILRCSQMSKWTVLNHTDWSLKTDSSYYTVNVAGEYRANTPHKYSRPVTSLIVMNIFWSLSINLFARLDLSLVKSICLSNWKLDCVIAVGKQKFAIPRRFSESISGVRFMMYVIAIKRNNDFDLTWMKATWLGACCASKPSS